MNPHALAYALTVTSIFLGTLIGCILLMIALDDFLKGGDR